MKHLILIITMISLSLVSLSLVSLAQDKKGSTIQVDPKGKISLSPPRNEPELSVQEIVLTVDDSQNLRLLAQQAEISNLSVQNFILSIEKAQFQLAELRKAAEKAKSDSESAYRSVLQKLGVPPENIAKYIFESYDEKTKQIKLKLKQDAPPIKP